MLREVLPDTWTVLDHDSSPVLSQMTVVTYVDMVEAGVTRAFRKYVVVAIVMSPKQIGSDLELEDAMEEVLEAIDLWDYPCVWIEAQLATYNDQYPCYKITTEMHVKRVYAEDEVLLADEQTEPEIQRTSTPVEDSVRPTSEEE
jgi:hypothetical protein